MSAGRFRASVLSAETPPAEAPMTIISWTATKNTDSNGGFSLPLNATDWLDLCGSANIGAPGGTVPKTRIPEIISRYEAELLSEWVRLQHQGFSGRKLSESQLNTDSRALLSGIREAAMHDNINDIR